MTKIKHFVDLLFTKKFIYKFSAYFLLISLIYILSEFLVLFLLTFIFAYLFFTLSEYLKEKIDFVIDKFINKKKTRKIIKKIIPINVLIVSLYIIFIWAIVIAVSDLLPKLVNELSELPKNLPFLSEPIRIVTWKLVEIKNFNAEIGGSISEIVSSQDIMNMVWIIKNLKSASFIVLQVLVSIILSFVILLDRHTLWKYLLKIKKSNFGFFYKEYKIIFEKIVKSFGLIFKAQTMIAFANSVLTVIWLIIIWLIHGTSFPYILTLWLIVFIAWFIPVLGVFISSIPILIIGYSMIWWYSILIEIVLLIAMVHAVEAYYLNPKILSKFLEIPVSLTFIILIISEHFFWMAWLLIWISLFYFIVWLLRDIDKVLKKNKKEVKKIKK